MITVNFQKKNTKIQTPKQLWTYFLKMDLCKYTLKLQILKTPSDKSQGHKREILRGRKRSLIIDHEHFLKSTFTASWMYATKPEETRGMLGVVKWSFYAVTQDKSCSRFNKGSTKPNLSLWTQERDNTDNYSSDNMIQKR